MSADFEGNDKDAVVTTLLEILWLRLPLFRKM